MLTTGVHHLQARILIHAPVEVCYKTWLDSSTLPKILRRVLGVEFKQPIQPIQLSVREVDSKVTTLKSDLVPTSLIKHWLFSGPGGKLYEVENTVILEVPNRFYCTTSVDPNDISCQSSVLFSPDETNQNTLIEWNVSFWLNSPYGKATQLAADILETGDSFLDDCLEDLKSALEEGNSHRKK